MTEAVRYAGRDLKDLSVLSVGTITSVLRLEQHEHSERLGPMGWGRVALDLLQGGASQAVDNQVRLRLGDEHYLRVQSENARKVALDDARECAPLQEWGHDLRRTNLTQIGRLLDLQRLPRPDGPTASS